MHKTDLEGLPSYTELSGEVCSGASGVAIGALYVLRLGCREIYSYFLPEVIELRQNHRIWCISPDNTARTPRDWIVFVFPHRES